MEPNSKRVGHGSVGQAELLSLKPTPPTLLN